MNRINTYARVVFITALSYLLFSITPAVFAADLTSTTLTPTDDANAGVILEEGQQAASLWKHSYYRFDLSSIEGDINNATFRVYYEEENAPTFYVGGVENDDWTEDGALPERTLIHDDPALQLDSKTVNGSGYVEFNVTDFVSSQISSDGIVTLELSANTGAWNIVSSKGSNNPPELVISTTDTSSNLTDDDNTGFALPEGQLAASKWKHSFFRFDISGIEGNISDATFRVYYEEENAPTFYIGAVENDDWTEDGVLPERTLIHDDPALQLDSKTVNGSGYVEFNVTDFVSSQISGDGIVTLELSANTGGWNIITSKEGANPPELIIPTTGTTSGLTDNANTGFALPEGQLATSKWKHSFFRFDLSDIDGDIGNATFRVYYEEENAPTFYAGGVENDDWTEDGVLPEQTLIHDDPALQLANVVAAGSGYVEFNVTDFVAGQISSDGIVTLELSASTGSWNIISSSESDNPPELVIDADVIDTTAPVAIVTFPTARSLTEGDTVTVRGTASDLDGVANIQVNGQNATSSDGFANWSIVVDLSPGLNTLTVTAIDNEGNHDDMAAEVSITSNPILDNPIALALDSANNRVLVLDNFSKALMAVDLSTGVRTIISDDITPNATNSFGRPKGLVLDSANNRALVLDLSPSPSLVAVDLRTGARTIISDDSSPDATTDLFINPSALVLDSVNNRVLVMEYQYARGDAVVAVDLSTGARTVFYDDRRPFSFPGNGDPGLPETMSLALDSANNRILVVGSFSRDLEAVDLSTGARTIISDFSTPDDTNPFDSPDGLVLDSVNNRVLVLDIGLRDLYFPQPGFRDPVSILAVDLSTGARTIISNNSTPDATNPFDSPDGLALDSANNRVLVADNHVVLAVDLSTGTRTIISSDHTPDNTNPFDFPGGLVLDSANHRALVVDLRLDAILAVDLSTGARTILSDITPGTTELALDSAYDRVLVVSEEGGGSLQAIDLSTGARTIVSYSLSANTRGLALDSMNNRVLVVDFGLRALVAIDLDSGAHTIISDSSNSESINPFDDSTELVLDSANNRVLVFNPFQVQATLVAVDLSTGTRAIISDDSANSLILGRSMTLDSTNNRALMLGRGGVLVVDLISGERVFLSR